MAAPLYPKTRFFYRLSDRVWLRRVDTQSPLSLADAVAHCGAEYGFAVGVVETDALLGDNVDALRRASRWGSAPPLLPTVSATAAERLMPSPNDKPSPQVDERALFAAATAAEKLLIVARKVGLV